MSLQLVCRWSALLLCLLISSCSSVPADRGEQRDQSAAIQWGQVDRVSVLTTDGQEIPLQASFAEYFGKDDREWRVSPYPLSPQEVRFTVIVYRRVEAPLVIEVGTKACQIGNVTYRGPGAEQFYSWVHKAAGQSLFRQDDAVSVEAIASDLGSSVTLGKEEAAEVWSFLQRAEYRGEPDQPQFPLYPRYRLNLHGAEREWEVTVVTPTLLSVQAGNDVLYYRVTGPLFSRLTQWLPPVLSSKNAFDPLFKATALSVYDRGEKRGWRVSDSLQVQGAAHQVVRLLKACTPDQAFHSPKRLVLEVTFSLEQEARTVRVYEDAVELDGALYRRPGIAKEILDVLAVLQR